MNALEAEKPRPATYADIEALPDHVIGEIIGGELFVSPRPAPPHTRVASRLGAQLSMLFDQALGGPGGWLILYEPELHLGRRRDEVVVPDFAGWLLESMPEDPQTAYYTVVPEWLCEVLSPSTARLDRMKKLSVYQQVGVRWVWLVDPLQRTIEVFTRVEDGWRYTAIEAGGEAVCIAPFEAVGLNLDRVWHGVAKE